jgi:hypothetical protein
MIRQLANNIFSIDKSRVTIVLDEIDLFYHYLQNNTDMFDDWYFKNIFTTQYWYYLKNYKWLSVNKQDYLHQGILSFIMFLCYNSIEGQPNIIDSHLGEVEKAIRDFASNNKKSLALKSFSLRAIELLKHKSNHTDDDNNKAEIYKSIKWTLINIIFKQENKNLNRR